MSVKIGKKVFGALPSGETASLYTLENGGISAAISDFGGVIVSLLVPDRVGKTADVVLGYEKLEAYLTNPGSFGALIGRNANRIANARVDLGGKVWELEKNDGENNLHSGKGRMAFRLFRAETGKKDGAPFLRLSCRVPHLGDGFPGNLDASVTYTLTADRALVMEYRAVSDMETVINLTNHSYFNLGGHDSGDIRGQVLQLEASFYTPNTEACIPTGEILSVEGTPFDFREGKPLGRGMDDDFGQIGLFGGYDHNFVLSGSGYRRIATARDPRSGRVMETWTDLPGVQLYTSNGMSVSGTPKGGAEYGNHQGFCLETQTFPDAVNMPWVRSPIYGAGQEYRSATAYRFPEIV